MTRASLLGSHTHQTKVNVNVHIYLRNGQYLARGRMKGKRFGQTLGADEKNAIMELRRMLAEIDDGRFVRSSTKKTQAMKTTAPERLTFLELCNHFIDETRKLNGENTAADYRARLMHVIRFLDLPESRRRWPYARDLDRDFALELRVNLHSVVTTRNGKPGAAPKTLSVRQMYNVMECVRSALHWAARPEIRLLPFDFANPLTKEIVGNRPGKDPLRAQILPLEVRVGLIGKLDCWQLATIGILALLPLRPEELQGILIGDVDFDARTLRVGTRFEGADFSKGKTELLLPLPEALLPVLNACAGDRFEGPLLRRRAIWDWSKSPNDSIADRDDFSVQLQERFVAAGRRAMSANDRKKIARSFLRDLGAVDTNQLGKEFKKEVAAAGINTHLYQMRHAVSTDMNRAGVRLLELRYLTGHSVKDIMNEYVALDPRKEMQKYFDYAEPLLKAIETRGQELGCTMPLADPGWRDRVIPTYVNV